MTKPSFFILGAPKCGTTALASYLSEHPSVFMTDPKEPHHYNTDLEHGSYKNGDRYLELFAQAGEEHLAAGEASVWYLYSEVAVRNILRDIPNAKFIVMLRNPVEMAPSLHQQMVFSGYETELDFQKAWALQTARREGREVPPWCREPKLLLYRDACKLGKQFVRASRLIPEENLLPIVFDDFKFSTEKIWSQVLRFIGVPGDGRKEFPVVNSARKRRSLLAKRVNDSYLKFRDATGFRGFGTGFFTKVDEWNAKGAPRSPLNARVEKSLRREFRDDIDRLDAVIDRDLSMWKE